MGVGANHSTESLGMARRLMSTMDTLFRASLLLGLLLAISGAASPWGGEGESQLGSHQSPFASNGVRSVMKRGAGVVKRKSDKKSGKGKGGEIKKNKGGAKKNKMEREKNKKRKNGKRRNGKKKKTDKKKKKKGKKERKNKGKRRNRNKIKKKKKL